MDWKQEAEAAAKVAGFDKCIAVDWDWANQALTKIDTVDLGGLGPSGILVVRFVPAAPADSVVAQFSVTHYPGTEEPGPKRAAVSTKPADLNPTEKMAVATGRTPKLFYCVGKSPTGPVFSGKKPLAASLTPGVTYYLNVACSSTPGDLRVQLGKPPGH